MWTSFWEQIRGNFKYDLAKYLVFGGGISMLTILGVFARKLTGRPPTALEWWLAPVVGLVAMAALAFFLSRNQRFIKLSLEPTSGPNALQFLNVTNKGKEMVFTAYGEIRGHPNGVNPHKTGKFQLCWRELNTNSQVISHGHTGSLLIAKFENTGFPDLKEASVWEIVSGLQMKHSLFRWNVSKEDLLPAFELQITIVGNKAEDAVVRDFILRPQYRSGPLELVCVGVLNDK